MAIVDVVILIIIGITALMGLLYGAGKSIIGLVSWVLSFAVAFFVAGMVADALFDIPMVADLVCNGDISLFNILKNGILSFEGIPPSLTESGGILEVIFTPLTEAAAGNVSVIAGAVSQHDATLLLISYEMFSSIICVLLFIVVRLIVMILGFIVRSFQRKISDQPKAASRLVGFAVSGVKGLFFVVMIFMFTCFMTALPFMGVVTEQIDKSSIGKPIFEAVSKGNEFVNEVLFENKYEKALDKLLAHAGGLGEIESGEIPETEESDAAETVSSYELQPGALA